MWDRAFANRLGKELPAWIDRGLLAPDQADAIRAHAEARAARGQKLTPVVLGVIGALIFGTGVILFFAANWDEMTKITKLVLLFLGMWGAYALGGYGIGRQAMGARVLGQSMLLLGVLLFGANIMLIAQIYHIDSHYPNGVLIWALGALALAWVVPSQPVATAGLALAVLWTGMESFVFWGNIHWPFLAVWAAFLPPVLMRGWRWSTAMASLALFIWLLFALEPLSSREIAYAMPLYVLIGMALYALGHQCADHPRLVPVAAIVQRFALVGTLLSAHAMVYTRVHGLRWRGGIWADPRRLETVSTEWIVVTILAVLITVGLAVWRLTRTADAEADTLNRAGILLAALAGVVILVNLFVPPTGRAVAAVYVTWNLIHAAALIWLVLRGYWRGDRFQVNAAFVFLGLGVLAIYFDSFWSLMNRSLFFMGGGALLVLGGYAMERQRRRLTAGMTTGKGDAT